jgi:hypothetical protein
MAGSNIERKRVVRVLVYEGAAWWVDETLQHNKVAVGQPFKAGDKTISEIARFEVDGGSITTEILIPPAGKK